MPLGLSKLFVVILFIAIGLGYGTNNWKNGLALIGIYVAVVLVWRFLTR